MEPDGLRAHALGVRYQAAAARAQPFGSELARSAFRLFAEHDRRTLRGCPGCWEISEAWAAAERSCADASRYQYAQSWVIALITIAVVEAGVIVLLGAALLGYVP